MAEEKPQRLTGWRLRAHEVIYESDTPSGKAFDVVLILAIIASVLIVMLESVESIEARYGDQLRAAEWVFTILFTIEYGMRLLCVSRPASYAKSFFGIVDLLSILPTYLSVLVEGAHVLSVVRMLRILRIFRVLKLVTYVRESEALFLALMASRRKIAVFVFGVVTLVTIFGALMYFIEGPEGGFTSIPRGVYWAIVTLTMVGYGDIAPTTDWGQAVASVIMIMGYGIIAVPTGIVTAELTSMGTGPTTVSGQACPACSVGRHQPDAKYCRSCGTLL